MKFTQAAEPTDIIWEHSHYTEFQIQVREIVAYIFIAILLSTIFYLCYLVMFRATEIQSIFPPRNCANIDNTYGDYLEEYAIKEQAYIAGANFKNVVSSGAWQCYCAAAIADGTTDQTPLNADGEPICSVFYTMSLKVLFWTNALSYIIIILNMVLRETCIALIGWIGYKTETKKLIRTTLLTFYVLFLNTAFLVLLVNANMTEQPISFGLSGPISDFNELWFRTTGNFLVSTMIFNAYYPPLEFFMYYGLRWLFRMMDSNWTGDKRITNATSIQAYIDIRAGPQYLMHFKYSTILNTVFVTMMYGFGIPILFPICGITLIGIYIVEKGSFYYSYKLPPMYDEKLSQVVLDTLMYAPLLYIGFGYWMASSRQILSNDYLDKPLETAGSVFQSQHTMQSVFLPSGWDA